ncbi:hypothetical protein TNCV_1600651 [Trichonephila clavipes]|nr:hypothetical protein TNCV_1600651 [Trichonephila clavipes]
MALETDEWDLQLSGLESMSWSKGSEESSVRGLELRQASICINRVEHSPKLRSTELATFMRNCTALLIIDSHKSPKCGVYEGIKDHSIPLRERKYRTSC